MALGQNKNSTGVTLYDASGNEYDVTNPLPTTFAGTANVNITNAFVSIDSQANPPSGSPDSVIIAGTTDGAIPASGPSATIKAIKIGQGTAAQSLSVTPDSTGTLWPISAASLPLPTGASTSALQTTGNSSLASIDGKLASLGQKAMAGSAPVVIASDQAAIPVNATLQTGANLIGSVKVTDGTNTGTVKAASTASIATDTAIVVAISPNNTVPSNITQFGSTNISTGLGASGAGIGCAARG